MQGIHDRDWYIYVLVFALPAILFTNDLTFDVTIFRLEVVDSKIKTPKQAECEILYKGLPRASLHFWP